MAENILVNMDINGKGWSRGERIEIMSEDIGLLEQEQVEAMDLPGQFVRIGQEIE